MDWRQSKTKRMRERERERVRVRVCVVEVVTERWHFLSRVSERGSEKVGDLENRVDNELIKSGEM